MLVSFFYVSDGTSGARIRENSRLMRTHVSIVYPESREVFVIFISTLEQVRPGEYTHPPSVVSDSLPPRKENSDTTAT